MSIDTQITTIGCVSQQPTSVRYSPKLQLMVVSEFSKRLIAALDHARVPAGRGRRTSMAKMFGVSTESVRKWLMGESMPETKRLPEIAKRLGVNANWLLSGEGQMVGGAANENNAIYQVARYQQLINALDSLPDHLKNPVADDLERLVSTIAASHITQEEKVRKTVELYNQMMADKNSNTKTKNKAS